jgi:hypothetical protein
MESSSQYHGYPSQFGAPRDGSSRTGAAPVIASAGPGNTLREALYADDENDHEIVTFAPKEAFKLGFLDVMCLVINRMIGEFAN